MGGTWRLRIHSERIYSEPNAMPRTPIGLFQFRFLRAVQELCLNNEPAYGLKIREWLERDMRHRVNVGQVYMAGKRLVARELLRAKEVKQHGKRPAILYSLTDHGEREIALMREHYSSLVASQRSPRAAGSGF